MRHFTDKTTEATISKFGSGVLYGMRMKVGIIKSVLIKAFILQKKFKKNFFSLSALYFKDFFRFNPNFDALILAVLFYATVKTKKTLALTIEGLSPLFRIAQKSSCKFYTTIELAQALGQSTEI